MAKNMVRAKQKHVDNSSGKGSISEIHASFDDYPLPTAEELDKLKSIEPRLIDFIIDRATKEQTARIEFDNRRLNFIDTMSRKEMNQETLRIIVAFLVTLSGMFLSGYLIYLNKTIEGTIFGGVTLIALVNAFLRIKNSGKEGKDD